MNILKNNRGEIGCSLLVAAVILFLLIGMLSSTQTNNNRRREIISQMAAGEKPLSKDDFELYNESPEIKNYIDMEVKKITENRERKKSEYHKYLDSLKSK